MLLPALLAMGAYLLFEVLDVVGSRLTSRLAGEAVAAVESTSLDVERLSHPSLSMAGPANPTPSGLAFVSGATVLRAVRLLSPGISPFRHRPILARASLAAQAPPGASPTAADPA